MAIANGRQPNPSPLPFVGNLDQQGLDRSQRAKALWPFDGDNSVRLKPFFDRQMGQIRWRQAEKIQVTQRHPSWNFAHQGKSRANRPFRAIQSKCQALHQRGLPRPQIALEEQDIAASHDPPDPLTQLAGRGIVWQ